jgi:hypothetical protein
LASRDATGNKHIIPALNVFICLGDLSTDQISWKQQSIQSSDRENDRPFGSLLINALALTGLATFRVAIRK